MKIELSIKVTGPEGIFSSVGVGIVPYKIDKNFEPGIVTIEGEHEMSCVQAVAYVMSVLMAATDKTFQTEQGMKELMKELTGAL